MQNDDETLNLLREMRDLMASQQEKYKEYLREYEKGSEDYKKWWKENKDSGSYAYWIWLFIVIVAGVSVALWIARLID